MGTRRQATKDRRDGRQAALRGTGRERLLDAAMRIFAARGYRAASVDEIVTAAGVTKGALYHSFGSKEELFFALLDERVDQAARRLMGITEHAAPDEATAGAVGRGVGDLVEEQGRLVLLLNEYWALAVREPPLRKRFAQRQRALRDALALTLEARHETTGVPLTVPAQDLATAIIAMATGLAQNRLADPTAVPDELFGEMLSLLYDGLAHRAGAA
jgi:AcrR family transcriptional regulator